MRASMLTKGLLLLAMLGVTSGVSFGARKKGDGLAIHNVTVKYSSH